MLVWSPYHTIVDSKCKSAFRLLLAVSCQLTFAHLLLLLIHLFSPFLSSVDEYISIAKEKHGYNVEQVRSSFGAL